MLGASSAFWRLNAWKHHRQVEVLSRIDEPDLGLVLLAGDADPTLIVFGEPGPAIAALSALVGREVSGAMMNREVYGALDEDLRHHFGPYWDYAWDFFWTDEPLAEVEHCERVEHIHAGSPEFVNQREEIRAALLASNPISDAVNEFDSLDWFILRAPDGNIATVMGAQSTGDGMGFHGLGTVPQYRGAGYGGATMVGAVNASLRVCPHVHFGVWAWNEGAMRLYTRLGIHHEGGLIWGRPTPFAPLEAQ